MTSEPEERLALANLIALETSNQEKVSAEQIADLVLKLGYRRHVDWVKEQEPIVLPEYKEYSLPNNLNATENKFDEDSILYGWNRAIDDFLRLNPQIRSEQ